MTHKNFLKSKTIDLIKSDLKNLGITLVILTLLLLITFYRGEFTTNLKLSFYLFISFIVPGYLFISLLIKSIKFYEKVVIGMITWMGVNGILSYYLNWLGVSTKTFAFIFPIVSIVILSIFYLRKNNTGSKENDEKVSTNDDTNDASNDNNNLENDLEKS
jgi:hypothetical protein